MQNVSDKPAKSTRLSVKNDTCKSDNTTRGDDNLLVAKKQRPSSPRKFFARIYGHLEDTYRSSNSSNDGEEPVYNDETVDGSEENTPEDREREEIKRRKINLNNSGATIRQPVPLKYPFNIDPNNDGHSINRYGSVSNSYLQPKINCLDNNSIFINKTNVNNYYTISNSNGLLQQQNSGMLYNYQQKGVDLSKNEEEHGERAHECVSYKYKEFIESLNAETNEEDSAKTKKNCNENLLNHAPTTYVSDTRNSTPKEDNDTDEQLEENCDNDGKMSPPLNNNRSENLKNSNSDEYENNLRYSAGPISIDKQRDDSLFRDVFSRPASLVPLNAGLPLHLGTAAGGLPAFHRTIEGGPHPMLLRPFFQANTDNGHFPAGFTAFCK